MMHSVTSLDHVRIEVLGGGRSVTATGGQWVDFRDKFILSQAVQEELDRAVTELRELRAERDTFRKAYDHVDSVLNEVKAERDRLRQQLHESIEYTETVDAMLDGYAPSRKDAKDPTSERIWLKERVEIILKRHEDQADKLSDCWLWLDIVARRFKGTRLGQEAERLLSKHKAPGWKD